MSSFYSYPYTDFAEQSGKITLSTGPVIVNKEGTKVLLHISETTHQYQFIGGRYDDTLNFRENALACAREVTGENKITLSPKDPLVLLGEIIHQHDEEKIMLIHYLGSIEDEENVGEAQWFTHEEVTMLDAENKTSSENVKIATDFFLVK